MTAPQSSRNRIPLPALLLTVTFLFVGYTVLMLGIDAMHMRPDEYLTFRNMQWGFGESMQELLTRNNQAPLWWMTSWLWQRLGGVSEFAGRVYSVLLTMVTLSLVYQCGREWFGERRYGWFALGLLSVNAYFFIYALEMRMYAMTLLTTTLSMRVFYTWLQHRTWQSAVIYGLSAALMLYVHYYLAFVILAQAAYFALAHLLDWRLVKQGVAAAATALVVWSPGAIILYRQLQFIDFGEAGGLKIPTEPTNLQSLLELAQVSSNGLWWLYMPLIMLGVALLWRKRGYRLALAWLLLSPGLVLLVNTQITIYTVRYTSYMAPAVALCAGATLAALPVAKSIRWGLLLGVMAFSLLGLPDAAQDECRPADVRDLRCAVSVTGLEAYIPVRIPYRELFAQVSELYQPGDALYVYQEGTIDALYDQFRRYLPDALLANEVTTIDAATEQRRVWFLHNVWFTDEVRAQFNTLDETHRVRSVVGNCTREWCYLAQLMVAPPRDEAIYFGETLGFLGADVSDPTNGTLPVLLWWEVEASPERDYAISLQVLDENGALVTQVDRQVAPPDIEQEIPTSAMQPDDNYIDQRTLDLPDDLAAGTYTLQLVVYQWWDNTRLTLPDGSDVLYLQDLTIDVEDIP